MKTSDSPEEKKKANIFKSVRPYPKHALRGHKFVITKPKERINMGKFLALLIAIQC